MKIIVDYPELPTYTDFTMRILLAEILTALLILATFIAAFCIL